MRYGVIADLHGNLPALQTAIGILRDEGVDGWICAGDIVGFGPHPNECVAVVGELGALSVAGNHDLMALGRLDDSMTSQLARDSARWTSQAIGAEAREFLSGLPLRAGVGGKIVVAHGSLEDSRDYVRTPREAARQLDRLDETSPNAQVLVLGHTHHPFAYARAGGPLPLDRTLSLADSESHLLNPGSVGQSRERRALVRFLLLDLDAGLVSGYAVRYDVDACKRDLRRAGLPARSCHLHPSRVRRLARRVRSAVSHG